MKMKKMSENKFERGWYTYVFPEGEVLISLEEDPPEEEEEKSEYLH